MCEDIILQNHRQDLVTKISLSSRTAFSPNKRLRSRLLGSEQTAVGKPTNFRHRFFQRATIFPIDHSMQRALLILNFRTEQFQKSKSAPEVA